MIIKFDMTCKNSVNFSPNYGGDEETWGRVRLSQNFVLIESPTIEDSFYNGTVDLPPFFYLGRQPNVRMPDGSIEADSVATWFDAAEGTGGTFAPGAWFGGGDFSIRAPGYNSPTYSWNITGGTPAYLGTFPSTNDYQSRNFGSDIHYPLGPSFYVQGINLGGSADGTGMVRRTTITGSAQAVDGRVGDNTFIVNWHLPLENTAPDPSRSILNGINYDYAASSWVATNHPITVTIEPASVWWTIAGGGSGLLAAGAAIWPGGPVGSVVGFALTGAGLVITATAPGDDEWPTVFGYDKYRNAVERQHLINTEAPDTDDDVQRVFPASLADLAYQELKDPDHTMDDDVWQNGGLSGRVVVARPWEDQPYMGDEYNANGFVGVNQYYIKKEDFTPTYVYQVKSPTYNGGF